MVFFTGSFGRLIPMLLVGGGLAMFFGGKITWDHLQTPPEPQRLTVRELQTTGYGDNPHVILTNHAFSDEFVYEGGTPNGGWSKIWIPLLPEDSIDARSFRVILRTTQIANEAQAMEMIAKDELVGVIRPLGSIEPEQRQLMQRTFPGVNIDSLIVFQYGKPEWSLGLGIAIASAGLIMVLVGVVVLAGGVMQERSASRPAGSDDFFTVDGK